MIQIQNMSTAVEYPHLTIDTDGNLRLGKSRYKVTHLAAEHFQHGWSGEELLRQHPDLAPGEVYSALAYFYDHREEIIDEIKRTLQTSEVSRPQPLFTKEQLTARDERLK
jgi:uncharacterized protein (DUF433 family)